MSHKNGCAWYLWIFHNVSADCQWQQAKLIRQSHRNTIVNKRPLRVSWSVRVFMNMVFTHIARNQHADFAMKGERKKEMPKTSRTTAWCKERRRHGQIDTARNYRIWGVWRISKKEKQLMMIPLPIRFYVLISCDARRKSHQYYCWKANIKNVTYWMTSTTKKPW